MNARKGVAPRDAESAREFARRLAQHCAPHLFEITLCGSRARGDADEESDLDLCVALQRDDPDGVLTAAALQLAGDLTLQHGV